MKGAGDFSRRRKHANCREACVSISTQRPTLIAHLEVRCLQPPELLRASATLHRLR
jgi:hypothetical protein